MTLGTCGACGGYARRARSPRRELRGRPCPKYGHVHRGCCRRESCAFVDVRGALRCGWNQLTASERESHRREARRDAGTRPAPEGLEAT